MLNIYLGEMKEAIYHPPTYFDNRYEDEWITDSLSVKMIKDVYKSDVVSERLIQSPVLGPISVKEISGGVKTLILMAFDDSGRIFNASACGNNCAKWILEIGKQKELIVNLRHIMDFGDNEFEIKILNKDQIVHNMEEFAAEVRGSDNYFVLITRENLYNLPYSVEEIYGLYASGRYQNTKKIYQQMYRIYSDIQELPIKPELFIDSKKYFSWERFFTNLQISSLSFALC